MLYLATNAGYNHVIGINSNELIETQVPKFKSFDLPRKSSI